MNIPAKLLNERETKQIEGTAKAGKGEGQRTRKLVRSSCDRPLAGLRRLMGIFSLSQMKKPLSFLRYVAALLGFLVAFAPQPLCAEENSCCGNGEEKKTTVKWTFIGEGWGTATLSGRYVKTPPGGAPAVPSASLIVRPYEKTSGEFEAVDGYEIEFTVTAHTDAGTTNPGSKGTDGIFNATWGCCHHFELIDWEDFYQVLWAPGSNTPAVGRMYTGEFIGDSAGQNIGQGKVANGSVHAEWNLGKRLGPEVANSALVGDSQLTPLLLALSAPPADGKCAPTLLAIPTPDTLHTLTMRCETASGVPKTCHMSFYAPSQGYLGAGGTQAARVQEWKLQNPDFVKVTVTDDFASSNPLVEWISPAPAGVLTQLRSGAGLTVFNRVNEQMFEMRFYRNTDFTVPVPHTANTPYVVAGTATPNYVGGWSVCRRRAMPSRSPNGRARRKRTSRDGLMPGACGR